MKQKKKEVQKLPRYEIILALRRNHEHHDLLHSLFPNIEKSVFEKLDGEYLYALTKYDVLETQARYKPSSDDVRKKSKTILNAITTILDCDPNPHKFLKDKHEAEDALANMVMEDHDLTSAEYCDLWVHTRNLLNTLKDSLERVHAQKFPKGRRAEETQELCLDLARLLSKYGNHNLSGYDDGPLQDFFDSTLELIGEPQKDCGRIVKSVAGAIKENPKILRT